MPYIVEVFHMDYDETSIYKCKNKNEVIDLLLSLRIDTSIEHISYRRA